MGDRNRKRRGSITHPIHSSSSSEEKTPTTSSHYKNYQRRIRRSYSAPHSSSRGRSNSHTNNNNSRRRSFTNQLQDRGRWHNFLEEFVPPVPHRFDTDHHEDERRVVRFTASAASGSGGGGGRSVRSPRGRGGNRRIYRDQNARNNNNNNITNRKRMPRQKSRQRVSWSDTGRKVHIYADDDDSSSSSSSDSSSSSSSSSDESSTINRVGIITAASLLRGTRSSSVPPNFYSNLGNLVWGSGEEETTRRHSHGHGDMAVHSYYSQYQQRSRSYQFGDVRRSRTKNGEGNQVGGGGGSRSIHPLAFFAEFLGENLPPPRRNQSQGSVDVQSVMSSLGSYAEFLPEEIVEVGNDELSPPTLRKNDSLEYSSSESSLSLVQRSSLEEENQEQQHRSLTMEEEKQQLQVMNEEQPNPFVVDEQHCPQQSAMDEEQQQQQQQQQQQFDTLMLLTRSTSPLTTIAEDSLETASTTSASSAPPLTTNAMATVKQSSTLSVAEGSSSISDTSGLNKAADSSKEKKKGNTPVKNKAVKGAGGNHPNAVDTVFPSKRAYSRGSGSKGIKFRERFMYNWDDGLYDNIVIQERTSSIPLCAADVAAGPTSSPNAVNTGTAQEDPPGSQDNCTASSSSVEACKRLETGSSLKTASTADSTVFSGMPAYSRHNSTTSQASAYTFTSMKSYLSQSQIRSLEDAPPELVDVLNQQLSILKTRRQDILEKAKLRKSGRKLNVDDSIRVENSIQFSLFVMKDKVEQLQDILGPLNVDVPDATAESVYSDTSGSADSAICVY